MPTHQRVLILSNIPWNRGSRLVGVESVLSLIQQSAYDAILLVSDAQWRSMD
jgi:hypothetical protein